MSTPAWITSQRHARNLCEQCGQHPATTEWAATGALICRHCCEKRQAVEAARLALILTPANRPEKDTAWDSLYLLVVGPPPDGSVPLPECAA